MQILVFLLMILAVMAQVDWRPTAAREGRTETAGVAAVHMLWTHEHALAVCTRPANKLELAGDCTVGPLHLGTGTPGNSSPGRYPTWWDGTALVTSWEPTPGRDLGAGELGYALMTATDTSVTTGIYSAADGSVGGPLPRFEGDPRQYAIVVPADLRAGLHDGYPVVLSCKVACVEPR